MSKGKYEGENVRVSEHVSERECVRVRKQGEFKRECVSEKEREKVRGRQRERESVCVCDFICVRMKASQLMGENE